MVISSYNWSPLAGERAHVLRSAQFIFLRKQFSTDSGAYNTHCL
jgi:hypothetical protein